MPVPARPEKLLEATYGPGLAGPRPGLQVRARRPAPSAAFNDWFRGLSPNARFWQRRYARRVQRLPRRRRPTEAARRVGQEARRTRRARARGRCRPGGRQPLAGPAGHQVIAYDYAARTGLAAVAEAAREEGLALEVRRLNLTEWRSVFCEGARLAHSPTARVVLAQHVLDATDTQGRQGIRAVVRHGPARRRHPGRGVPRRRAEQGPGVEHQRSGPRAGAAVADRRPGPGASPSPRSARASSRPSDSWQSGDRERQGQAERRWPASGRGPAGATGGRPRGRRVRDAAAQPAARRDRRRGPGAPDPDGLARRGERSRRPSTDSTRASEWSTGSSSTSGCRRPRPPTSRPSSGATGTGCGRRASSCRGTGGPTTSGRRARSARILTRSGHPRRTEPRGRVCGGSWRRRRAPA